MSPGFHDFPDPGIFELSPAEPKRNCRVAHLKKGPPASSAAPLLSKYYFAFSAAFAAAGGFAVMTSVAD
jgi:hypothetical protein